MLIAGDPSGDALGAELIGALRDTCGGRAGLEPRFFGVGGPKMQGAGMELIFDFTRNAVFGLEALKRLFEFRRQLHELVEIAAQRRPDAIICVDFSGFNRRFAHAVRRHVAECAGGSAAWKPRIVQYVSPQVWASRPGRADSLAQAIDLLLAIFPFEKAWYRERVPSLRVEFVGHPIIDRYREQLPAAEKPDPGGSPSIVLFPGSRPTELKRHLPVMLGALDHLWAARPGVRATMVLSPRLADMARRLGVPAEVEIKSELAEALRDADLAIAKSGTITLECGYFGVPTVAMYRTSLLTYGLAKCIVQVKWIAMPNILANEEIFPEFIQRRATASNIGQAALELLEDAGRRNNVKAALRRVAASLGPPGASRRAAGEILRLLEPQSAASSTVSKQP